MNNSFLLFGSSGHLLSCIDVIMSNKDNTIVGYVSLKKNPQINLEYLGNDENFITPQNNNLFALIAFGNHQLIDRREYLFNFLKNKDINFKPVLSNNAYISKDSFIGKGTVVMHNSIINHSAIIGDNCIINTGAIIEHEVNIGNNTIISPGSIINGAVSIGNNCFIGSGTIIHENIKIEDNAIIGSNLCIRKNINNKKRIISQKQID